MNTVLFVNATIGLSENLFLVYFVKYVSSLSHSVSGYIQIPVSVQHFIHSVYSVLQTNNTCSQDDISIRNNHSRNSRNSVFS